MSNKEIYTISHLQQFIDLKDHGKFDKDCSVTFKWSKIFNKKYLKLINNTKTFNETFANFSLTWMMKVMSTFIEEFKVSPDNFVPCKCPFLNITMWKLKSLNSNCCVAVDLHGTIILIDAVVMFATQVVSDMIEKSFYESINKGMHLTRSTGTESGFRPQVNRDQMIVDSQGDKPRKSEISLQNSQIDVSSSSSFSESGGLNSKNQIEVDSIETSSSDSSVDANQQGLDKKSVLYKPLIVNQVIYSHVNQINLNFHMSIEPPRIVFGDLNVLSSCMTLRTLELSTFTTFMKSWLGEDRILMDSGHSEGVLKFMLQSSPIPLASIDQACYFTPVKGVQLKSNDVVRFNMNMKTFEVNGVLIEPDVIGLYLPHQPEDNLELMGKLDLDLICQSKGVRLQLANINDLVKFYQTIKSLNIELSVLVS